MSLTCWLFGHEDIRERTVDGYSLHCERCGSERPMLQSEVIKGPKHQQAEVMGKPRTTVFRDSPFGGKRKVG